MNKNTNVLLQRLKKNLFTTILTFTGLLIGIVLYIRSDGTKAWYVQYSFPKAEAENLPLKLKTDTVFNYSNITIRNFSTSKADTLQNIGLKCHELKLYSRANQTETVITDISAELLTDVAQIHAVIPSNFIKNRRAILYYGLAGFLLGMLIDLLRSKKTATPSKNIRKGETA